eukprot:CAMPEP_0119103032 /NCGR_PEP_ID=MMETSP1180-20130426/1589_1 /TAXON_ID=3052 ORGANISM="Chlamydomonas cf sp, Strain CCMP681" /NCGR_SAMPLE_ID=MMETSP1180 /ASSEMBLY_ACC=CAM_ASM_000741 /LENGTH=92 /DNA_ID=CAMNT_0007087445 /DNA_START=257 /DNA_END=536 /DNA_ORIENTATION=+
MKKPGVSSGRLEGAEDIDRSPARPAPLYVSMPTRIFCPMARRMTAPFQTPGGLWLQTGVRDGACWAQAHALRACIAGAWMLPGGVGLLVARR